VTIVTSEPPATRLRRTLKWNGVRTGDPVEVEGVRERRLSWVFVAHVLNVVTNEVLIEVRGGRAGEAKGRSFRAELIYPKVAQRGSRRRAMSLARAPQLDFD